MVYAKIEINNEWKVDFLPNSPPWHSIHLFHRVFHWSKHLINSLFWYCVKLRRSVSFNAFSVLELLFQMNRDWLHCFFKLTPICRTTAASLCCSTVRIKKLNFFKSKYQPSWLGLLNIPTASLQRGKTPTPNDYPGYDTKQSDSEALVLGL